MRAVGGLITAHEIAVFLFVSLLSLIFKSHRLVPVGMLTPFLLAM